MVFPCLSPLGSEDTTPSLPVPDFHSPAPCTIYQPALLAGRGRRLGVSVISQPDRDQGQDPHLAGTLFCLQPGLFSGQGSFGSGHQ